MSKVTNSIKKNFTIIPNQLILDNTISDRARFIFVYMASKPDNWDFYIGFMCKELRLSEDTVRKYINELCEKGWIIKCEQKNISGRFGAVSYILNSEPKFKSGKNSDQQFFLDGDNCYNKEVSSIEEVYTTKKDINNYDNFSNSDLQSSETKDVENIAYNIHPKKNKEEEEKRPSGGAAEEQFEKFWSKYPVKTSKSECKKKFLKLLEKDRLEILENIDMYVAYKPFLSYRHPNPTTFINQRRWEDEDYKTRGNGTVYKNQMDDISALFD